MENSVVSPFCVVAVRGVIVDGTKGLARVSKGGFCVWD